jgi:transcriptional regulator with XRE-family HTH domain
VDDLAIEVGDRVRALRLARGLSRSRLARRTGLPAACIRALEQGQWPIRGYTAILQRVANALEAAPHDLDDAWRHMHTTPVRREHEEPLFAMGASELRPRPGRAGRHIPAAADGLAG